jgi:hypothetical protein
VSLKHIPLLVCALAALTATAGAQFTAAVVPPKASEKRDTTIKQDSVRRATVALAARVTDMRKWVDSAAGVSLPANDSSTALASNASTNTAANTSTSDTAGAGRTSAQIKDSLAHARDSVTKSRNDRVRTDSATSIATVEVHDSTGLKGPDSADSVQASASSRSRGDTKRFAAGATAPATATMLPFLALAGVTTLLAGLALRRT